MSDTASSDDGRRFTALLQIMVEPEMVERLDRLGKAHGITRSAFIRLAVTERLEQYEALLEAAQ